MKKAWNNILKKISRLFFKNYKSYSVDDRYNIEKNEKEKELDYLLDKINGKGMDSLSTKEKKRLEELSK